MEINKRIKLIDAVEEENAVSEYFNVNPTVIKVVGVGNGGCNAVNRMIEDGLEGVSFIAMNTDAQALYRSNAETRLVLGEATTGGLGAGTNPEKGAQAAIADEQVISDMLKGSDLVFIASGFGGGTGTGASPVIANIARKLGALTIGVITKPFEMEGSLKMKRAEEGIKEMLENVDSLIVIPNENLYDMFEQDIAFEDALKVVDDILRQGVQGISDIITQSGFGINVDFADVKTMISLSNGRAHLGIGVGTGEDRLEKAAHHALNNPLLDVEHIRNAKGILANIVCPENFGLTEYKKATKIIGKYAAEDANIKIGVCKKEDLHDEIRMTIVATGFEYGEKNSQEYCKETEEKIETPEIKIKIQNKNENMPKGQFEYKEPSLIKEDDDIAEAVKIVNSIKTEKTEARDNFIGKDETAYNTASRASSNRFREAREMMYETIAREKIGQEIESNQNHSETERKEEQEGYASIRLEDKLVVEKKNKLPFDIVSEEEMKMHTRLGEKSDYAFDENDLEVPAFLRRPIETRK